MARDDHPRTRQRKALERKQGKLQASERLLIVCEGKKTETQYFEEIRQHYKLQTASVQILHSDFGTAPTKIVEYAEHLLLNGNTHAKIPARHFDRAFAVFDRDEHHSYFDALQKSQSLNRKYKNKDGKLIDFTAIPSVPCFELWLLIHFQTILHPLHRDEAFDRLRQRLPGYDKGMKGTYWQTRNELAKAKDHARQLAALTNAFDGTQPFTAVAELVSLMQNLKPHAQ